jgi:hypothetical protein
MSIQDQYIRISRAVARRINKFSPVNLTFPDRLTRLANRYETDKGTNYRDCHNYTRIYSNLFEPLRNRSITFLEIGLFRADQDVRRNSNGHEGPSDARATRAPSLQMWREYFPKALLVGFDIDDFSSVRIDNCIIIKGDMSSRDDLANLVKRIGRPIDVVIDDGSHVSHHQQIAFSNLFPHLASGGLYIIEDLHWQDLTLERPCGTKTRAMFQNFMVTGKIKSEFITPSKIDGLESRIASVDLFDSTQSPDALAVIRSR